MIKSTGKHMKFTCEYCFIKGAMYPQILYLQRVLEQIPCLLGNDYILKDSGSEPLGYDPLGDKRPFHRSHISDILYVRFLHFDS